MQGSHIVLLLALFIVGTGLLGFSGVGDLIHITEIGYAKVTMQVLFVVFLAVAIAAAIVFFALRGKFPAERRGVEK